MKESVREVVMSIFIKLAGLAAAVSLVADVKGAEGTGGPLSLFIVGGVLCAIGVYYDVKQLLNRNNK